MAVGIVHRKQEALIKDTTEVSMYQKTDSHNELHDTVKVMRPLQRGRAHQMQLNVEMMIRNSNYVWESTFSPFGPGGPRGPWGPM